ncbi:MAG: class I SAM-dependent DNA methyltransferase, partial [Chloroflexota bacterium]
FQDRLAAVTVLDPACGSGNFLSVALAGLKGLEKEVAVTGAALGLAIAYLRVSPRQMLGLEINAYARELAQATVWLTHLKWMLDNGFGTQSRVEPILEPLETIRLQDALLAHDDAGRPIPADWPAAEFIVGNPPFLGGKRLRTQLGDACVDDLFAAFDGAVAREADLCCYFFEKARQQIAAGESKRAGLLATNSIRGGANRDVLKRIKESGDIFMAWSDQPWILDGAAVRISIVGFDDGSETTATLDGERVVRVNADLTASVDITRAARLRENLGIALQGPVKVGPFELDSDAANTMLTSPPNPNGRPNADIIQPWVNGLDIVRRPRHMSIIDFGSMDESQAALYELPFEYVLKNIKPLRDKNADPQRRNNWWRLGRSGQDWKDAATGKSRVIVTARVAKHRLFVFLAANTLPDSATVGIAREDDYFFGVLHSRAHERWSLRMGTWMGKGNDPRYTPTTCFETFPLPWPPGREPQPGEPGHDRLAAIAAAAADLDAKRRRWLDPEGASDAVLKTRTLTNLYNERPAWLRHAHAALDRAVWAAYGWEDAADPDATAEEDLLARLLALNAERAAGG